MAVLRGEAQAAADRRANAVGCSARSRSKVLAGALPTFPTLLFRRRLSFGDRLLQEFVARFEILCNRSRRSQWIDLLCISTSRFEPGLGESRKLNALGSSS